jgi:hypothetical protein
MKKKKTILKQIIYILYQKSSSSRVFLKLFKLSIEIHSFSSSFSLELKTFFISTTSLQRFLRDVISEEFTEGEKILLILTKEIISTVTTRIENQIEG